MKQIYSNAVSQIKTRSKGSMQGRGERADLSENRGQVCSSELI